MDVVEQEVDMEADDDLIFFKKTNLKALVKSSA